METEINLGAMGRGRVEGGDIILIPVVPSLFTYSPCPRASIPILPFISITIFITITPHLNIYLYPDLDVDPHPDLQEGLGFRVQGLEFKVRDRGEYGDRDQSRGGGGEMEMEVVVGSSYLYLHLPTFLPTPRPYPYQRHQGTF